MFGVVCKKHQEKLKKMSGFTEAFIQESDNFNTSALLDHSKSKMHAQAINESKYVQSTKHEEQYRQLKFL